MFRPRSVAVVRVPAGRFPFSHPPLGDDHDYPPSHFYHVNAVPSSCDLLVFTRAAVDLG